MSQLVQHIITSPRFKGSVSFRFDPDGVLYMIRTTADMEIQVRKFFMQNASMTKEDLQGFVTHWNTKGKELTLVIQESDLTFSMIYEAYNLKKDRKRAEAIWIHMPKEVQLKAFLYLTKYDKHLKTTGAFKMELKSYLRAELWND
jgi:hypothetical protein